MTRPNDPTMTTETEMNRNRAQLASTLDELHDRMSVEHLAHEALDMFRDNVGAYTHSIDKAIRANPMALALTGAGLAWLVFGGRKDHDAADRREDSHRPTHTDEADAQDRAARTPGYTPQGYRAAMDSDDHGWMDKLDDLRRRASQAMSRLEHSAKDYATESSRVVLDFTADMRDGLRHGLDDLSDAARERVMQARQSAYAARLRMERGAREKGRQVGHLVEEHPIIAGAIAVGLGAAFAAALPRTRIEDRSFGAQSDRLMDAAARMLREERARMSRVAHDVADEVKAAAGDAASAVAEGVEDLAAGVGDADKTKGGNGAQKRRASPV